MLFNNALIKYIWEKKNKNKKTSDGAILERLITRRARGRFLKITTRMYWSEEGNQNVLKARTVTESSLIQRNIWFSPLV